MSGSTIPEADPPPPSEQSRRLADLLRDLPPEHRAIVECLDADREAQVRAADRQAAALQRLQEASAAMARVPERDAIVRELVRHAARLAGATGAVVVDMADAAPVVAAHWNGGVVTVDPLPPDVRAAIDDAARTGRPSRGAAAGRSVLAVPIRASHRVDGVVAVYGMESADHFDLSALLSTLAATAAASLGMAATVSEGMRERRQAEALAELGRALGSSHRLGEVLHLGLRHSTSILGTEGADIMLVRGDYLHVVAASGCAAPSQGIYLPIAESAAGRAMLVERPLIANAITPELDASALIREVARVEKFVSVPMRTPDGPIGVLSVINRVADFGPADVRVLDRLATQLAVAVVKVRLFEEASDATRELRAAFDAIAGGMAVVDGDGFIVRHNARLGVLAGVADDASLVGHSVYEAIFGSAQEPTPDDPIGTAVIRQTVGRGVMRRTQPTRVFEVVASPHPNGGAVITVDDVTSFLALAERYRLVVESTTDAILIADASGAITFASDAAATLFGRDVANAGLRLAVLAPGASQASIEDAALRALGGEAVQLETAVAHTDGEPRLVSASLAPVRGPGDITGFVASLRDITGETHARAAMAAADSRYRRLFESAGDAIFTVDGAGIVTSANAACERSCGLPRDAIVGRRLTALMDPSDSGGVATGLGMALSGRGTQFECAVAHVDGSSHLMSVSFSPVTTDGAVTGVFGVARDLTRERAQAAALERAESRYARLFEAAEDGICTIDEEGWITSGNRSFRRVVRLSREQARHTHFADVVPPDQRDTLWALFTGTLAGARQRAEVRYVSHHARDSVVSVSTTPIVEHDRVTGVLAILRDVTEERALFDRAARRDKLAALGELVGGVAHEVNSPLTGILAHAQLLQSDVPPGSEARHAVDTIVNEARRAARIVSKLLMFARQNPSERMPTDINQVILDTLELRRYPLRMQDVELSVQLAPVLPPVWADPFQLQQVFINLLSNAEQAAVARASERRIEIRSELKDKELVVSVTDSGAGIAPEHLPHIFNPFYTTKPKGIGTGLGLSISFGIVREHGGYIQAISPPSQGATFTVHLPIRDARTPVPGR